MKMYQTPRRKSYALLFKLKVANEVLVDNKEVLFQSDLQIYYNLLMLRGLSRSKLSTPKNGIIGF